MANNAGENAFFAIDGRHKCRQYYYERQESRFVLLIADERKFWRQIGSQVEEPNFELTCRWIDHRHPEGAAFWFYDALHQSRGRTNAADAGYFDVLPGLESQPVSAKLAL